ncbi:MULTISPECIES: C39 family peptidase [Undibacterium]|uniref:Peptidase C39 family protein n=1 Tax=Undibacterium parvum TaxID=401471 RepID=A0A3S9HNI4_9BURK|nr:MULTISPECIES: C39 family peptidase [Undibacterium]AZP13656.1 peptidase C39 family protein [Undibacterium parvum]
MLMLLASLVAVLVGGSAIWSKHEPLDRPKNQFELQQTGVGGGPITQSVVMEPFSELKYKHIARQAFDYSCGSAALVTILNFHLGLSVTEQEAMEGMLERGEKEKIIARRGFSLLDMKRYVAGLNIESAGFRGEVKDLLSLEHPAIVPIDYAGAKHFVVLRGVRDGIVYIADPSAGNIVFSLKEFATLWDRNTLFIVYPPKNRPILGQLALSDMELGVTDMDRVKDKGQLQMMSTVLPMERVINGYGGISIIHR